MITNKTQTFFTKSSHFKPTFQISKYAKQQQKFLTIIIFQHSQITQKEFEQLVELLLKNPMVYANSKFDVGKVNSPLHLSLKPDAIFKNQRISKVSFHLQDKVNRLLDFLEQYEIISPVFPKRITKRKHIHKSRYYFS